MKRQPMTRQRVCSLNKLEKLREIGLGYLRYVKLAEGVEHLLFVNAVYVGELPQNRECFAVVGNVAGRISFAVVVA